MKQVQSVETTIKEVTMPTQEKEIILMDNIGKLSGLHFNLSDMMRIPQMSLEEVVRHASNDISTSMDIIIMTLSILESVEFSIDVFTCSDLQFYGNLAFTSLNAPEKKHRDQSHTLLTKMISHIPEHGLVYFTTVISPQMTIAKRTLEMTNPQW